jgi:ATP-dependent DNA ligase
VLEAGEVSVARLKLRSTILDGEIIAVDENGIPRFQLLQRFQGSFAGVITTSDSRPRDQFLFGRRRDD